MRLAVPALIVFLSALSYHVHLTNGQCNNATTTVHNAAEASSLVSCTTFTGNIAVATDYGPIVALDGMETIIGSVVMANNSVVTAIGGDKIQSVTDEIRFDNLPLLTNLSFPMWSSVGTLILNKIPAPDVLNMQTTVQQVGNLYITDTTLETLFGLLLQTSQMENLQITGNQFLQDCWFGVGNITQQATILNNNDQMSVTLPNLTYAYNMEISNATAISMPLLESVSQSLDIRWNSMHNLSIPKLSFVGEDLSITHNAQLDDLSIPDLVDVQGDLSLSNNALLQDLDGLLALSDVGGDLTFEGGFTNVSLPSIRTVRGNLVLQSFDKVDCSSIPSSVVEGSYSCNGKQGSSSSHHGLSGGTIAGIVLALLVLLAGTLGGILFLLRRKKRKNADASGDNPPAPPPKERGSDGFYDYKSSTEALRTRAAGQGDDVAMDQLDKGHGTRQSVREVQTPELLSGATYEIYELPASPNGGAHELPSVGSREAV